MKKLKFPVKELTLGYLIKDNQVLLAMKKRGFGEGKLNGIGGKLHDNETIEEALIRETIEEIGVTPLSFEKVATLDFYYPGQALQGEDKNFEKVHYPGKDDGVINRVHTFLITDWSGEITESDEMLPDWYEIADLPVDKMWESDKVWLLKVLQGEKLSGDFFYDIDYNFLDYNLIYDN